MTPEEIAELERMERESAEQYGPEWIADKFSDAPEGPRRPGRVPRVEAQQ